MDSYQKGIGLTEVLIALVVFSLGVVGMAGLQLRTLGMSIDSTQRSVVITKAQDMADRIRSSGVRPNSYVGTYDSTNCAAPPADVCADTETTNAISCSAAQMVTHDVWDVFCASGSGALEGGVIQWSTVISCSAGCNGTGAQMSITTTWQSRTADKNADIADNNVTNADNTQTSAVTDSLTLTFIP